MSLRTKKVTVITDDKELLRQIENYYSDLYSSKICVTEETLSQFTVDVYLPQLSYEECGNLEGLLTYEECKATFSLQRFNGAFVMESALQGDCRRAAPLSFLRLHSLRSAEPL